MKKLIANIFIFSLILSGMFLQSCTDLEEETRDKTTSDVLIEDPDLIPNLIAPSLGKLRELCHREGWWGIQEASSDELCFPTRGTDWFDGGVWQQQWLHNWTSQHRDVQNAWNVLNEGIAAANFGISVLGEEEDVEEEILEYRATLKFLRSFFMYCLIDLYGISPYRDAFDLDYTKDPLIMDREQAFDFIVNDMRTIIDDMPEKAEADYGIPNRDAGLMLLAKMYINKEVYIGEAAYDSALIYLNEIVGSGNYALADDYFGMFGPDNHENHLQPGDEGIFVIPFDDGDDYGMDDRTIWVQTTFHYNQTLMGAFNANWNGCMAPQGYLEECWFAGTDTATDARWVDSTIYPVMAVVNGFNYGQQHSLSGSNLQTRGGSPLIFTVECSLTNASEAEGVRVLKYAPRDVPVNVSRAPNDFLFWRYADVVLMKIECDLREGTGNPLTEINELRTKRNAPTLSSVTLDDVLAERGRELYWEGHRRQDMIRFGTFLLPKTNKTSTSPETAKLLPIPQTALDAMPDLLDQNNGY